jgi:hypothetical protein
MKMKNHKLNSRNTPHWLRRLVRPTGGIQSENGVALLLDTVLAQNHQSPTAHPTKVSEIVRDAVRCPKCLEMFLEVHNARLKECLEIVHDQWKSAGEPDLGELPVEQMMKGRDYLFYSYIRMAESLRPNEKS